MNSSASWDRICPYEDRRTPRELYLKLFVICFTTLTALSHLIHTRGDYALAPALVIFFFVSPITVAAHLATPMLLMLIQLIVLRKQPKLLLESLAALIGQLPKSIEAGEEPISSWNPALTSKLLLRSIPLLGVLAQSVASVWVFGVRSRSGGAALYDHFVLQLACIAILSSVWSLIHLFLEPRFPADSWEKMPKTIRWLRAIRPMHRQGFHFLLTLLQFHILGILATTMAYFCGLNVSNGMSWSMDLWQN